MKLNVVQNNSIETYPYLEVGAKISAKTNAPEILHKALPIYSAEYESATSDLDLLIITADLQGVALIADESFLPFNPI